MPPDPHPRVLLLTGPTGIGKTALAVELAERHDLEIISADSMQVYRGMEIGTAQPTPAERERAPFHLAGVWDPARPFNVAEWLGLCQAAHEQIVARGRRPIYVGGTGMYLRALRWGLLDHARADPEVRAGLEAELAAGGPAALHSRLAAVDPEAAASIAPADAVRIVRALEIHAVTGRPASELRREWADPTPRFPHALVVLVAPRDLLRARIAARTDAMLGSGWIEETGALLARGISPSAHCFKALGYREIIEHLNGSLTFPALRERIVTLTAQFARRQMTWLRRERPAIWLDSVASARALDAIATRASDPPADDAYLADLF